MDGTLELTAPSAVDGATHRDSGCLVAGCPCKDARIVSTRRTRFFAALARRNGETANRAIAPEADWAFPSELPLRPSFGALA